MRGRRNPRNCTADQKSELRGADIMAVRARIFELGVSKFLEDEHEMDARTVQMAAEILANAASQRHDSEEIYARIRREAAETAKAEELETEDPAQPLADRFFHG